MNQLHKKNIQFVLGELEKENKALLTEDLSTTTATEDSAVGVGAGTGVGGSRGPGEFSGGASVRKAGAARGGGAGVWVKPGLATQHKEVTEVMTESTFMSSIRKDPRSINSSALCPLQMEDSSQTDSGGNYMYVGWGG